jgi:hypothetical protein
MPIVWLRRNFLRWSSLLIPAGLVGFDSLANSSPAAGTTNSSTETQRDLFPSQPPELAREMVTVCHFSLKRVRELVEIHPSLARASWDWGFGDWETCLGAASHMGNRPIAEFLIANGARPSLFSAAMLGQLEVVKAFVTAQPGVQRIRGPHSISLLAHAQAGHEQAHAVLEFLQSLGDADIGPPAPLSEAELASIVGTYTFGWGANDEVEVSIDGDRVVWTRKGTMGRQLFHLGNRFFYPSGCPSVKIRFADDSNNTLMTVDDAEVVLTARRKQVSKGS